MDTDFDPFLHPRTGILTQRQTNVFLDPKDAIHREQFFHSPNTEKNLTDIFETDSVPEEHHSTPSHGSTHRSHAHVEFLDCSPPEPNELSQIHPIHPKSPMTPHSNLLSSQFSPFLSDNVDQSSSLHSAPHSYSIQTPPHSPPLPPTQSNINTGSPIFPQSPPHSLYHSTQHSLNNSIYSPIFEDGPNIFSPFLSEVFGFSEDEEKEKEEEPMNLVSALLNEMSSFVEKPDPNDDAEQLLQPSIPAQTHRSKHIPTLNTHYSGMYGGDDVREDDSSSLSSSSLATILGEEVAGEIHKRKRGRPKGSMGKRRKKVEMRQIKMRERTKELEQGLIQQKQEETSQSIKKKRERLQRSREKMLQTLKVSNAKWEKERQLELSKKAVSDDDSLAFLISSNEENLLAFQEPLYTFRTRRQTPHPPQSLQTQKIGKLQRTLNPIGPKMKRRARRATPKLPPPDKAPRKDTEASQPPSQSLSQNESSDSLFKSSDHSPKITSPRPKTKRPQKAPKLAKNPVRFPPLSLPPQHTTPLTPPFVVPTTLTKLAPLPTTLLAHPSTLKPSSTFRMPTMNSHQLSFHSTLPRPLQSVSNKLNSSFHPPFLSGLPFPRLSPSERTRT